MTGDEELIRYRDLCVDLRDAAAKYKDDMQKATDDYFESGDSRIAEAAIQQIGEDLRLTIRTVMDLLLDLRSATTNEDLIARIDNRMAHVPEYAYKEVPE